MMRYSSIFPLFFFALTLLSSGLEGSAANVGPVDHQLTPIASAGGDRPPADKWSPGIPSDSPLYYNESYQRIVPNYLVLDNFFVFQGDSHNDFIGDTVITLSDGSGWKVHPGDTRAVESWMQGDQLRLALRKDFYFFKREHKFLLVNTTLKKAVRAMLIDYGPYPLYIVSASQPYATSIEWVPVPVGNGVVQYLPQEANFQKELVLSDGRCYVIKKSFDYFSVGDFVHYGLIEKKSFSGGSSFIHFITSGIEREVTWTEIFDY